MRFKFLLLSTLIGFSQIAVSAAFYNDTFELGQLNLEGTAAFSWTDSTYTAIVAHPAKVGDPGSKALQFSYPAGANESEQRFSLAQPHPEIWIRYWAQVPTNFKHNHPAGWPSNCKLFAIWMDDYSNKGLGATVIWEFWEDGSSGSQLSVHYSEGNNTITGEHLQMTPFITYPSDQGRWMQIVLHVRASTTSTSSDGLIEMYRRWSDENSFKKFHNLPNIKLPMPAGGPAGWKAGYFMGWTNPSYVADTLWFINDVEFSDTSLLSLSSAPNPPAVQPLK